MADSLEISVIIPTYKDWDRLQLCVNALGEQNLEPEKFEILVVNNEREHRVPSGFKTPPNLNFLHEPKSGSYAARNKAIKRSSGVVLAFTDSDCIPDKKWLKNACLAFKKDSVERLAGEIELFYKNPQKRTWAELYESVFAFNQKANVEIRKLSVTANFIVRKSLFTNVGLFDETQQSGEDWGWNRRATKQGISIDYDASVKVAHPARYKIAQLAQKMKRVASGIELQNSRYQRIIKIPRLFLNNFIRPSKEVFRQDLPLKDKLKVITLVFYLYLIYSFGYCKLLCGIKTKS